MHLYYFNYDPNIAKHKKSKNNAAATRTRVFSGFEQFSDKEAVVATLRSASLRSAP